MKIQGLSPDSALLTFGPTMLGAWWCNGDLILIYWAKWPSNGNSMVIYIVVKSNHQFHNETQISEITNANVQNMATDVLKVEHTNGQMTDTALIIIHLLVVEWFLSFYFATSEKKVESQLVIGYVVFYLFLRGISSINVGYVHGTEPLPN